jgi:probable F420-dependent oxidoreductase
MKFGLMPVNAGPYSEPGLFEALVRTAEEVGIESIWAIEHVVVPLGYQSRYPFTRDGRMPMPDDAPIGDPLLQLAYAASLTRNLRLGTAVIILPQRHPAYVAKEVATLDRLSGGRVILGVGIGWLREEFKVVGVPFSERANRAEESIRAIRSLWGEKPEPFEGDYYRWTPVESHPKPVQQPGVPILVGGHAEAAGRRAARVGDGFFPAWGDFEELAAWIGAMRDECAKMGRNPSEVEITTGLLTPSVENVRRYEELGVSRLVIPPPAFDPEGLRRGLNKFADRIMARV